MHCMKLRYLLPVIQSLIFGILLISCYRDSDQVRDSNYDELLDPMSSGDTTIFDATSHAFALPAPNLSEEHLEHHIEGDATFEAAFVTAPSKINSGLGPIFNNTPCINCHVRNGRGKAPSNSRRMQSMLLRLSLPSESENGSRPKSVPGFGTQLNDRANFGLMAEGKVSIRYLDKEINYRDGKTVKLRDPSYTIYDTHQDLPTDVQVSPRVAQPVFGAGLLEAISSQAILDLADENDQNRDGISGRPNYVLDVQTGKT